MYVYCHILTFSVTEREIERGILKAKDTKDHCMAYVRHISNVNLTLLRFARNFIDMAARDVDSEAQKLLTTLRDDKLPQKLPAANIARFVVEWSGKEGIDRETHAEYLKEFCSNFYSNITMLVDRAVISSRKLSGDAVYSEVLQQLHSCQTICKFFQVIFFVTPICIFVENLGQMLREESGMLSLISLELQYVDYVGLTALCGQFTQQADTVRVFTATKSS